MCTQLLYGRTRRFHARAVVVPQGSCQSGRGGVYFVPSPREGTPSRQVDAVALRRSAFLCRLHTISPLNTHRLQPPVTQTPRPHGACGSPRQPAAVHCNPQQFCSAAGSSGMGASASFALRVCTQHALAPWHLPGPVFIVFSAGRTLFILSRAPCRVARTPGQQARAQCHGRVPTGDSAPHGWPGKHSHAVQQRKG